LLISALRTIFKDTQSKNYSLKKLNISISDTLNTQVSIKTYYLKSLLLKKINLTNIYFLNK